MDELNLTDFTVENIPLEDSIVEIYRGAGE